MDRRSRHPGLRIPLAADLSERMRVNGEPLDPPPGLGLMLHKPRGVTCSHKEAGPLSMICWRRASACASRRYRPSGVSTRTPPACCC